MHGELQVNILRPAQDTDLQVSGNLKVEQTIEAANLTINGKSLEEILSLATPIGSIIPFGGDISKIQEGWVLCDGSLYPITGDYNGLFQIIGKGWGGNEDYFRVPDLTGRFMRGVSKDKNGNDKDNDPDRNERDKLYEDDFYGNTGNFVGTYQGEEILSHGHVSPAQSHSANNGEFAKSLHVRNDSGSDNRIGPTGGNYNAHRYSTENFGGNETRPKNAAVNFIIKYK